MMELGKHDRGFLSVYLESMSLDQYGEPIRRLVPHEESMTPSVCVYLCGLYSASTGSVCVLVSKW